MRNINLRHSNIHEYFRNVLHADIVCLQVVVHLNLPPPAFHTNTQETKVTKLTREVACVPGYESFWSCSVAKPGYSGVATFCASPRFSPVDAAIDCLPGADNHDLNTEGRHATLLPIAGMHIYH